MHFLALLFHDPLCYKLFRVENKSFKQMKSKEKPRLKTGAHFVSGSLKITRKTDEEQEKAAQADRSVLVVRDYSSERDFDEDITHLEWKNKSFKQMKSKEKPRLKTGAYFLYVTV